MVPVFVVVHCPFAKVDDVMVGVAGGVVSTVKVIQPFDQAL